MRFAPVHMATNQSMTTSFKSIGIDLNQTVLYSIEAVFTGSPVGSFNLEVSNDIVPVASSANAPVADNPAANVVNWVTYTGSSTAVAGPGNFLWNCLEAGYRWVRVSYTADSGTGSATITFSGKGI